MFKPNLSLVIIKNIFQSKAEKGVYVRNGLSHYIIWPVFVILIRNCDK